jgi:hypothetical protein
VENTKAPPLRVEVAPVGYYTDRVVDPIKFHKADRVYLVRAREDSDDLAAPFRKRVITELRKWKPSIEIRVVQTDLWTMESAVETFSAIIRREVSDGNSVWVNLSTGSKLEAVASAVACMGNGGVPYYVRMKSYERSLPTKPLAEGVDSVDVVPTFGLSAPSEAGLQLLDLLAQNHDGLSKKNLISGLTDLDFIPKEIPGKTIQARYARLQAILDRLREPPPLVVIEGRRRGARVKITERGRLALRIFSPRLGLADSTQGLEANSG